MKKLLFIFCCLVFSSAFAQKNQSKESTKEEFRRLKNNSFAKGEKITYLAHYGFINAGEAVVKLDENVHLVNERPCYKVEVEAKTVGVFGMTVKVQDLWRSYIDTSAIIPHKFYRNISENNYKRRETIVFHHKKKLAKVNTINGKNIESNKDFEIPVNVQDMISGYYFLRTIEFEKLKNEDIISMDAFFEDKLYDFKVRYLGKEKVKTKFGKINAIVVSPIMPDNELFKGKDAIKMWISDDMNRVPLKVKADFWVGAFEVDITDHKGLKHDFNFVKTK